jgi:predicted DNA-binding transcriptional regulator YafY
MSGTPTRLLALLSLLQTPRSWSGTELADRLEVSPRTVRRDVDRLRDLGYPVEATRGMVGGYRLVAGTAMPPLLLDDDEAVAIAIGLRTVTSQAIGGVDEASARALAKLEQVLPARLRGQVGAVAGSTTALPGWGPSIDPDVLTALARATAGRAQLRFVYEAGDGTVSRRMMEPERLVVAARRWYLVGWDLDRDDRRMFRVDRITDPWSPPGRVRDRPVPGEDPAAFVARQLYASAPTPSAVVTVHAPAAAIRPAIRDGDTLDVMDERTSRLTMAGDTIDWLAARLLTLGVDFTVHEPSELIDRLRGWADRIGRFVSG